MTHPRQPRINKPQTVVELGSYHKKISNHDWGNTPPINKLVGGLEHFFHILGIIILIDLHFSEELKPPTSKPWFINPGLTLLGRCGSVRQRVPLVSSGQVLTRKNNSLCESRIEHMALDLSPKCSLNTFSHCFHEK